MNNIDLEERYTNKPFLRLLEAYVFWAIDNLSVEQASLLESMTPKLQKTYATNGKWHEIIAKQMEFPSDFKNTILNLWNKNRALAESKGYDLTAEEFTLNFVDINFPR